MKKAGQGRPNVTSQTPFGEINSLTEGGPQIPPCACGSAPDANPARRSVTLPHTAPPLSYGLRVRDLGTSRLARVCGGRRGGWEDGGLGTLSEVGLGGCVVRPAPRPNRVASSEAPKGMVAARLVYGRKAGLGLARRSSSARPPADKGLGAAFKTAVWLSGHPEHFWGWAGRGCFLLGPWAVWRSLTAFYTAI